MKKSILYSLFVIFSCIALSSCRDMKDDQPVFNRILGIWELQSGEKPIYNFKSGGELTITQGENIQNLSYTISYENYENPASNEGKSDVVRIGENRYKVNFTDSSHMIFTTSNSGSAPLNFVRVK